MSAIIDMGDKDKMVRFKSGISVKTTIKIPAKSKNRFNLIQFNHLRKLSCSSRDVRFNTKFLLSVPQLVTIIKPVNPVQCLLPAGQIEVFLTP